MKDLFQKILDNFDNYFSYGLCSSVMLMAMEGLITWDEVELFFIEIDKLPNYELIGKKDYKWKSGEREPRIEWLKEQIKKFE